MPLTLQELVLEKHVEQFLPQGIVENIRANGLQPVKPMQAGYNTKRQMA